MLKAGFAEKILEVAPGQPLMGHTRDTYAATGTHDSLCCKVIVWQDEVHTTGFIALDLCMVDAPFVNEVKRNITRLTGVDGDSFVICATHTHAGPAVFSLYEAPVMDESVRQELVRIISRSVGDALETLQPVEFRFGTASCMEPIGFNRRLQRHDGTVVMNWEPVDPDEVVGPLGTAGTVVRVVEMIGESLHVSLVNYPLHPAILDYTNSLYSRDYPGYLEKAYGRLSAMTCMSFLPMDAAAISIISITMTMTRPDEGMRPRNGLVISWRRQVHKHCDPPVLWK